MASAAVTELVDRFGGASPAPLYSGEDFHCRFYLVLHIWLSSAI